MVIHNCKCLGPFLAEPFLHITVTKHCHSSGPESRAHLLPIFGINEPCQAEGTLHKCSGRWKPYVWCTNGRQTLLIARKLRENCDTVSNPPYPSIFPHPPPCRMPPGRGGGGACVRAVGSAAPAVAKPVLFAPHNQCHCTQRGARSAAPRAPCGGGSEPRDRPRAPLRWGLRRRAQPCSSRAMMTSLHRLRDAMRAAWPP